MAESSNYEDLAGRFADASASLEAVAATAEKLRSSNDAIEAASQSLASLAQSLGANAETLASAAETLQKMDIDALSKRLDGVDAQIATLHETLAAHDGVLKEEAVNLQARLNRVLLLALGALLAGAGAIVVGLIGG